MLTIRPALFKCLLLLPALALTACVSVDQTLIDTPQNGSLVYVGVRSDWQYISHRCGTPVNNGVCRSGGSLWPLAMIDLPFSALGDTLLLPYTEWKGPVEN